MRGRLKIHTLERLCYGGGTCSVVSLLSGHPPPSLCYDDGDNNDDKEDIV